MIAISTFSAGRGPPGLGLLISRAVRQVRRLQPKKEEPSETWTGPGEFTRSSLACFFCWKGPGGWQDVMEGGCPGSALPGAYRKKSSSGSLFARVLALMADAGRWGDARCHVSWVNRRLSLWHAQSQSIYTLALPTANTTSALSTLVESLDANDLLLPPSSSL